MIKKKYSIIILLIIIILHLSSITCFAKAKTNDNSEHYVSASEVSKKLIDIYSEFKTNLSVVFGGWGCLYFINFKDIYTDQAYNWDLIKGKYKIDYNEDEFEKYYSTNEKKENGVLLRIIDENINRGDLAEAFYKLVCFIKPEEIDFDINSIADFKDEEDLIGREKAAKYMIYKGYMKTDEKNKFNPFDYVRRSDFVSVCWGVLNDLREDVK